MRISRRPRSGGVAVRGDEADIMFYGQDGALVATSAIESVDAEGVAAHRWSMDDGGYLHASIDGRRVSLHRWLMRAPLGMVVDHINRDRLDNRRRNLRVCTSSTNNANKSRPGCIPNVERWRSLCDRYSITNRLPTETLRRLRRAATRQHRTRTEQILHYIEDGLARDGFAMDASA